MCKRVIPSCYTMSSFWILSANFQKPGIEYGYQKKFGTVMNFDTCCSSGFFRGSVIFQYGFTSSACTAVGSSCTWVSMIQRLSHYAHCFFYWTSMINEFLCDRFYFQAPEVPELTHQGVFQLWWLSVNCYIKTAKNSLVRISWKHCHYHRQN